MLSEVTEEVLRKDEPEITVYRMDDDAVFHERKGRTSISEKRRRRRARPGG